MPERRYVSWKIRADETTETTALVRAVAEYGLPFIHSTSDLPAMASAIQQGLGHGLEYRLPVVLALMGRREDAHLSVVRAIDQLGVREDAAAREFRQFAETLQHEFDPEL
jgi:hypothetical protein